MLPHADSGRWLAYGGSPVAYALRIGLLAGLYLGVAKLSLLLAIPPGYATAVWPPSGLAVAALLLFGNRMWPGVWLGAALANLMVHSSPSAALLIGTGNALEALAGAALMRRYVGMPRLFRRGEDVFRFAAIAAVASALAATIGVAAIALTARMSYGDAAANWWTWWQGDVTGIIVIAPLLLFWKVRAAENWPVSKRLEATAFALALALAGYVVFGSGMTSAGFSAAMLLTFPFVIWAALRFDQLEVAATVAALCVMAIAYTITGRGPFAPAGSPLLLLLAFVSIVALTGLVLSAVVGERRRAMAALREEHSRLEDRVAGRTQELERANRSLQQDIVARTILEDDLRRSEEKFRLLVEGIRDYAIFMLDVGGHIVSWNAGAERIKGYAAAEIIGRHFSCFYPQEALDRKLPQLELEVAAKVGRFEDEGWRLRKDGTAFWANVIITGLFDSAGKLRGYAKVTRDMTERRRVEQLEYGERKMNEFLAMLGHELRNPLAPIRNALDLMRVRPADESMQQWSRDVIDRQLMQLTRLVDDLLDIGRISSGKITLHMEPIELDAVVLRAVEAARPLADARGHSLDLRLAGEPIWVDGDLTRLSQAVLNIVNNAIKYTPEGGRIIVQTTRENALGVVRVIDTGVGMSGELLPTVFDLFVQGERSLDRSEGGLGIGLTLVKRLVTMHGGYVAARSDGANRGSEFEIRLLTVDPPPSAPELPVAMGRDAPLKTRRRMLVIDDNRDSADTLAALLEAWQHEVRTCYDGPSAIAAAADFRPDVVLLDIGLPRMSGYEVAARLRKAEGGRSTILVAFTGYGQDDDRRRVREAGFDYHLVKPLEPAALDKILQSLAGDDTGIAAEIASRAARSGA